jgi:uncharacterized protein (TIGR04255 family)
MTASQGDLTAYAKPPIDEVVLGVQFPPIPRFSDAHAGLYWQRVRANYPQVQSQPRLEGSIESPGQPQPVRFEFPLGSPPQSRTWLIGDTDEYLIQIQNTRFIFNWRQRQKSPYPRFDALREQFVAHFEAFQALLHDEGLDQPEVQQVEVSYINWIVGMPPEVFFAPARATELVTAIGKILPEDQNLGFRYLLEETDSSIKRLYVQCQSAFRQQAPTERGYQLSLVYKAAHPSGFGNNEISMLLEEGRVVAGSAFTELTTPEAHRIWEKYQ